MNEIKVKKGVDLLQNLIKYFHAQCKYVYLPNSPSNSSIVEVFSHTKKHIFYSFFQDGIKVVDNMKPFMEKLATELTAVSFTEHSHIFLVYSFLKYLMHVCVWMAEQANTRCREETADAVEGCFEICPAVRI